MPKTSWPPGAIFCRSCGYCLHGLPEPRCPECGNTFDPTDSKSFRLRPARHWRRRVIFWGGGVLLVLALAYGGCLGWLYVGWRAEAPARDLASGYYDELRTRSVVPPALSCLLIGRCRQWQERVESMDVRSQSHFPDEFGRVLACRRLRSLRWNSSIRGEDLAALPAEMRELEFGAGLLHPGDLARLSAFDNLERLGLEDTGALTDADLAAMPPLKHLSYLFIDDAPSITDAAVPHLSRLTGLKELWLGRTSITHGGMERLRGNLPLCGIGGVRHTP